VNSIEHRLLPRFSHISPSCGLASAARTFATTTLAAGIVLMSRWHSAAITSAISRTDNGRSALRSADSVARVSSPVRMALGAIVGSNNRIVASRLSRSARSRAMRFSASMISPDSSARLAVRPLMTKLLFSVTVMIGNPADCGYIPVVAGAT
jgi:hypothetical protein